MRSQAWGLSGPGMGSGQRTHPLNPCPEGPHLQAPAHPQDPRRHTRWAHMQAPRQRGQGQGGPAGHTELSRHLGGPCSTDGQTCVGYRCSPDLTTAGGPSWPKRCVHVPPPIPGALDAFEEKRERKTKKSGREGRGLRPFKSQHSGLLGGHCWTAAAGRSGGRGGRREKSGESRSLRPRQAGEVHQLPRWFTDGMTCLAPEGPRDHRGPPSVGWACGDTWFPSWVLSPTHSPPAPRESEPRSSRGSPGPPLRGGSRPGCRGRLTPRVGVGSGPQALLVPEGTRTTASSGSHASHTAGPLSTPTCLG